ncbi:MAG: hypothetical protein AB7V16_08495 [Vulcanibacillus sp.]
MKSNCDKIIVPHKIVVRGSGERLSSFIQIMSFANMNQQAIILDNVKQLHCISELTPPSVVNHSTVYLIVYRISNNS